MAPKLGFHPLDFAPACVRWMEMAGIEITRAEFQRAMKIPGDGHPSVLAHQAYTAALFEKMVEMGLVATARPGSTAGKS